MFIVLYLSLYCNTFLDVKKEEVRYTYLNFNNRNPKGILVPDLISPVITISVEDVVEDSRS
jgi:hypothetical protein